MAGGQAGVLQQMGRLWNLGAVGGMTDAQLLARFGGRHKDGADLAFEALVEQHEPMVFRVCRGILRDEHAAEDAFQATFLVLAPSGAVPLGVGVTRELAAQRRVSRHISGEIRHGPTALP
jgi:hypothetical protein